VLVHPAEESFQKGLELLDNRSYKEALAYFNGAIEIEKRIGQVERPQARYLSYYGLCLSLTDTGRHEAVRCCRLAAQMEAYRPDICWNLGRVLLAAGRRREAHKALKWGLRLQSGHKGLRDTLKRMGVRRRPVLTFLDRAHPVNVFLGRIAR
jgi:tetratricopeptide (TPR) repeat protein